MRLEGVGKKKEVKPRQGLSRVQRKHQLKSKYCHSERRKKKKRAKVKEKQNGRWEAKEKIRVGRGKILKRKKDMIGIKKENQKKMRQNARREKKNWTDEKENRKK